MSGKWLVVGLGNPGKSYEGTRHNVGFAAVEFFAKKQGLKFKKELSLKSEISEGLYGEKAVLLLKPITFMNLSGEAVAETVRYYKIDLSQVLIIADDVDLPLGQLKIKTHSGSGGHNGLKSIEESLQTNAYARLKMGVGGRESGDLSGHVLGRFSPEEEKLLPGVLERAVQAVEIWLDKGLTSAMGFANPSTPSIGDKHG